MDLLADDLVCTVCNAEFLDIEDLQVHVEQVHLTKSSKNRYCKICIKIFPDIVTYALHIRNEHINSFKCCKYCIRLFNNTKDLQQHEKKHDAIFLFPKISCSHCENTFVNKYSLVKHEYKEHSNLEDGLVLQGCLPILSSLINMNMLKFYECANKIAPYICAMCDTTTTNISVYIQHLVDKDCRSLSCDECCGVYKNKSNLISHIQHCEGNVETIFENIQHKHKQSFGLSHKKQLKGCNGMSCGQCNMTFTCVNEYTDHVTKHRNKMLMLETCIYCQRQMVGTQAMMKHVERAHKNEKHLYKYHCNDCDRIFKHPKFLFAHFYSKHKDLHPYTCNICDKKFRIRKNFTLHIKLDHKSVGFVEFDDNFYVTFTDKRSCKQSKCQDVLEKAVNKNDDNVANVENVANCDNVKKRNSKFEMVREKSDIVIEVDNISEIKERKRLKENKQLTKGGKRIDIETNVKKLAAKRKLSKKHLSKRKPRFGPINLDIFSDDSDVPLETICKRRKLLKRHQTPRPIRGSKSQSKKFICTKCNRNCYTYQNFHRHKAMHLKNKIKVCIKCQATFDSVKKLNEHVKTEHSSSKLTETLKKLLDKRKKHETNETKPSDIEITPTSEAKELTTSEKFRNTVKKIDCEKTTTKVSCTIINNDKLSVKKYIENFIPENNEVKLTMLPHSLSLEKGLKRTRPLIKLTKFTPESIPTSTKLQMPVKFTDDMIDKCDLTVQLVEHVPSNVNYGDEFVEQSYDNNTVDNSYNVYEDDDDTQVEAIPEVAQEVLLVNSGEPCKVMHSMSLKNLTIRGDIAIAHLLPEAPFYKISKFKGLLEKEGQSFIINEPPKQEEVPKDITLPNGKKLVNVNPLAHLLDKSTIDEVFKSRKYNYSPKLKNITEAITKAMVKLEKPALKKKVILKG